MRQVATPQSLAAADRARIDAVASGRATLLPVRADDTFDSDLSRVEVALCGHSDGPTPAQLLAMPRLRWIHSLSAGIDDLVSPELRDRHVLVTNSAGVQAPAMTEYVLCAMVMLARDLLFWVKPRRTRDWRNHVRGRCLYGKRAGIVGYGGAGRHLASACRALGMQVWATKRTPIPLDGEPLDRLLGPAELHELLANSDFVILTASLNSSTRGLVGKEELAAMKAEAFLVNVARGVLVDQAALAVALHEGSISGAILDVTEPEPLPPGDPLWDAPNLWITPHIAGDTPETRQCGLDLFCSNLALYLDGQLDGMANVVDLSAHM